MAGDLTADCVERALIGPTNCLGYDIECLDGHSRGQTMPALPTLRQLAYPVELSETLREAASSTPGLRPESRRRAPPAFEVELAVLHTSTSSFRSDVRVAEAFKQVNPGLRIGFVGVVRFAHFRAAQHRDSCHWVEFHVHMTNVLDINAVRFNMVADTRHQDLVAARPATKYQESKNWVPANDLELQYVVAELLVILLIREMCVLGVESQVQNRIPIENVARVDDDAAHGDATLQNDEPLRQIDTMPPVVFALSWKRVAAH